LDDVKQVTIFQESDRLTYPIVFLSVTFTLVARLGAVTFDEDPATLTHWARFRGFNWWFYWWFDHRLGLDYGLPLSKKKPNPDRKKESAECPNPDPV